MVTGGEGRTGSLTPRGSGRPDFRQQLFGTVATNVRSGSVEISGTIQHIRSIGSMNYVGSIGDVVYSRRIGTLAHMGTVARVSDVTRVGTLQTLSYVQRIGTQPYVGRIGTLGEGGGGRG
ncbi:hypothetical protein LCGC14_2821030, partial [marine sediment metagenome]